MPQTGIWCALSPHPHMLTRFISYHPLNNPPHPTRLPTHRSLILRRPDLGSLAFILLSYNMMSTPFSSNLLLTEVLPCLAPVFIFQNLLLLPWLSLPKGWSVHMGTIFSGRAVLHLSLRLDRGLLKHSAHGRCGIVI